MDKIFYSDIVSDSNLILYSELYEYLSSEEPVIVNKVIGENCNLFKNIIKAICYNIDITLLDENISQTELDNLAINNDGAIKAVIEKKMISSLADIRYYFKKSTAQVTIFTSGTTGQPKKVSHTVASLIRNVRTNDTHKDNSWALTYNATHMAGLQVLFQALLNENPIFDIYTKPRQDVFRAIQENKITHISGTPTFYRLLMPIEVEFEFVERVSLGGEKSDASLIEKLKRIFPNAQVNNIYASTEAGTLLATRGEYFYIPESLKDKIKIIDKELVIHSSLLGKMNQSQSDDLNTEWYFTNDIIEWVNEANGQFKFSNRKNEMINVGGYKINPHEIESIINSINGVASAVVYSKPNSILGNILCCNIQSNNSLELNETALKTILKEKLAEYKIPRKFYFVDKIETTKSGKQLRSL